MQVGNRDQKTFTLGARLDSEWVKYNGLQQHFAMSVSRTHRHTDTERGFCARLPCGTHIHTASSQLKTKVYASQTSRSGSGCAQPPHSNEITPALPYRSEGESGVGWGRWILLASAKTRGRAFGERQNSRTSVWRAPELADERLASAKTRGRAFGERLASAKTRGRAFGER